jgi:hypothetical protein
MDLLGDVGHVESCFVRIEAVLVLVQDRCTVLRQSYHSLRNHFGRTGWYS